MLCLFFPPALPAPGCLCSGRAVGTVRMTREAHGKESDPVLTQGAGQKRIKSPVTG